MPHLGVTAREHVSAEVPGADIRTQLERILGYPQFQASDRRRAFLRFVVEETLAGRADRLKAFPIAVAVFGRDETFDSQTDPVVRLEARRLRRDLDSYYVDRGAKDPVRISIPKGSYVPNFEWHEAPQVPSGRGRQQIADFRGRSAGDASPAPNSAREPAVVVLPFRALGSTEDAEHFALGISQELISDLFRFPGFRLYTQPVGPEGSLEGCPTGTGRDASVTYVVSGTVRIALEEIHVTTQVSNAESGQILWAKTYSRPSDPRLLIDVQRDLAAEIASVVGQPYGVVKDDISLRRETPAVSSMQSYVSVLRAYGYRRSFLREDYDAVLQCLQQAVQRDPAYSDAWAMLGWLHVDAGRLGYTGEDNRQNEYETALQATSRAVALQPANPLALKALAAAYHYVGRYDDSERTARQAADLNPHDPEALAQLGWRLAARGRFDEGIPLLKRAIERTVNPPGWYYHLVAVDLYLKGDSRQMLAVAERSALGDPGFSQLLLAVANGELGDAQGAQQALAKLSLHEPVARDPAGYIRRHGATDRIVDALMAGLQKAHQVAARR